MLRDYIDRDKLLKTFPALRLVKTTVIQRLRKMRSHYGRPVSSPLEGSRLIRERLLEGGPFMAARIGATELECIMHYFERERRLRPWQDGIRRQMSNNAGFFPAEDEALDRFAREFINHIRQTDLMGVWYNPGEDSLCRSYCPKSHYTALQALEPYYHSIPWSEALAGRRVLVIHPYAETIASQYHAKRTLLFADGRILPPFELITLKAVQSIANTPTPYSSWFEAYEHMCSQTAETEFDVALIGAGAYGLPLASWIKQLGKQAIHMGGSLQILFGIRGKRWDDHKFISRLYNDAWVRPADRDIPHNFKKVENGCYW